MTPSSASPNRTVAFDREFATTHWSLVLATRGDGDSERANDALEELCRTYWYPLYYYVRRRGYATEDARDLTQQFFARFLERGSFARADPARGRLRSFLLASLGRFLTDEWRKARRGPSVGSMFDMEEAEVRYAAEISSGAAEDAYDEQWALALIGNVLEQMRRHYDETGHGSRFAVLRTLLVGDVPPRSHDELARELALTDGAFRVAVHRLREDFRHRLRTAVSHTVSSPEEIDAELHHLVDIVGRRG